MTTIINCTPHAIVITNGPTFEPSGTITRVSSNFEKATQGCSISVGTGAGCIEAQDSGFCSAECLQPLRFDGVQVFKQKFGTVIDLPEPEPGTVYIVSAMVLSALAGSRSDVVTPATGHPECVRNEKGHIISVPGFVRG